MLFYYNPCRLILMGHSLALFWAIYMAKRCILPSHKGKTFYPFFLARLVSILPSSKNLKAGGRSRLNPAHQVDHVTRTQTPDRADRLSLTYPKNYILRLQAFTGSHSSLLKTPLQAQGRKTK